MLNAFLMFMVKQQLIFDLRTFVANSTLSRLRAFGGHFWPKSGGRGHANTLYDQGLEGRTLFLLGKRDETKAARKAIEEELVLVKKILDCQ